MKEKILKIVAIIFPVTLFILSAWCLFSKDQHFPWIGTMIKNAERQQNELKNKIQQQIEIMKTLEPAAQELFLIRKNSFSTDEDVIGRLRSRVEQTLNTSGAKVRTIATPRQVKSMCDIELYEINLTGEIKTSELLIIAQEFSKPPFLHWRTVSSRPNNMQKPEWLNMNITIAAVGFKKQLSLVEDEK